MKIDLDSGRYVVAVSGGVDSMVLLELARQQADVHLTVAHFDHGMRPDSKSDRLFVQAAATRLGLPFVFDQVALGAGASEATARAARYAFLEQARQASQAAAIITAHHEDDVLETALLNLMRGTGRKGLTSLQNRPDIRRPLLDFSKQDILKYALANGISWHEDVTNQDQTYKRNFIRHSVVAKLSRAERQKLVSILQEQRQVNAELDDLLTNYLHANTSGDELNRKAFNALPRAVAQEVMASWLRDNGVANFDKKTIERAVDGAGNGQTGNLIELKNGRRLVIGRNTLALRHPER